MYVLQVDLDGTVVSMSADGSTSSDSDSDDDMEDAPAVVPQKIQPVIDDDGFELVQSKSKSRGPHR